MIRPDDLIHCKNAIRTGSLSFHSASKLLPGSVRDPALALYAFCRLADDEVDEGQSKERAVIDLENRLALVYAGTPRNAPEDRAFAAIVEQFDMPRALPEALLEGLAWDAIGRRYQTLSDLHAYSARVASAVGVMMCVLMGVRDRHALARACDLGAAMQLTNIARDVGEDARAGRLYLPLEMLDQEGLSAEQFLNDPQCSDEIKSIVAELLKAADRLYLRSQTGIAALPRSARTGIFAARLIYAGIGSSIRRNGFDSICYRARTTSLQKMGWISQAGLMTLASCTMPRSAVIYGKPLAETAFLVDAAARSSPAGPWGEGRSGDLIAVFAELRARDGMRA
ncbi:15-cis-phytoene synthase [Aestuariibius insulae]|uniref:15-cis-phytoene synthase n=1 Tax=Aestuariibius insulae TaxID=2058287 RepID=UPI00345E7598